jgi:HEAT repeat protein
MTASRSELILAEGARDVRALQDALDATDPTMRALALGSLSRIEALSDEQLHTALSDNDRTVRVRAVELSITRHGINLVDHLQDVDDLVVETSAWALGERESADPKVVSALMTVATTHEVSICREAAIAALGAIGSEDGLPAILAGLDDRAPVRRRAVLALAPFDTPEVTAALNRATQDRDRQVRQAAEDLL